ncbi:hypothetical protein M406DRAFT_357084 [Cryphonectria parasitica EP155]|uniref:Uncharacterized protein n=1 Tax=Cryphonectria parasitica (strain ATCC 38755 / EP155) TaxID=660469 RepID=A0A9P4XYV0_CRYP1|nr:uncharacterized protein M406DRAFT_357084 [Cryphonectria parasitica EP155]KAF3763426.1 hypothetical protein M406DRAFT_357084 [Cryphonectria parasitica EP155]
MEESYESIRNSAMVWPAVIVAALTMAYIFGDVWRDRSGRGGEIAVAEQPAVRVEDKAQDQESMMAAEDLKRSSDRVASHSQVHERGRGSLLGWLMWAPGSVAK